MINVELLNKIIYKYDRNSIRKKRKKQKNIAFHNFWKSNRPKFYSPKIRTLPQIKYNIPIHFIRGKKQARIAWKNNFYK